ncbi:hypothetical protein SCHPADRAFT_896420 [Schizopora paradoxa]|uniref:BAH domain-containing protein n=1 Tax=Schizopora paradoxa TaxID=27342 RepID=A0A0H2R1N9_9AGAM|nr:hypothetical protein SCHPADRAFT_896420 [Schizopora paradoxa]
MNSIVSAQLPLKVNRRALTTWFAVQGTSIQPGDDILIVPENRDPKAELKLFEYWVGVVQEIRGKSKARKDTFIIILWYLSKHSTKPSAETTDDWAALGDLELLESNWEAVIDPLTIQSKAEVIKYCDTDLREGHFDAETFYTRFSYDVTTGRITFPEIELCLCNQRYNPDTLPMALCVECQTWYHTACLIENGHVDNDKVSQNLRDTAFERLLIEGSRTYRELEVDEEDYDEVPDSVLELARSRIVRGLSKYTIVGNADSVLGARKFVKATLETGTPIPRTWMADLLLNDESLKTEVENEDPFTICPKCQGII